MTTHFRKTARKRNKKIMDRLKNDGSIGFKPMMSANLIRYELSEKVDATICGGIGVIHKMNQMLGLPELINANLHLLSVHRPYFESDHVLNMAYNIIVGGKYIEDLELRRTDTAYMSSLGAKRVPDPTTAGDFLRRFETWQQAGILFEINNKMNETVWKISNGEKKRKLAILDVDGKIVETSGEFKQKLDMTYKGVWGFSTLILTEATTGIHLFAINREGNAVSQEKAGYWIKRAVKELLKSFEKVIVRGDTAYYLTGLFDELNAQGIKFITSVDQFENLKKIAENIDEKQWVKIEKEEKVVKRRNHEMENVKERKVVERGYDNILQHEEFASEFSYTPSTCKNSYRIIVVRQLKEYMKGGLFQYFYYEYRFAITNIRDLSVLESINLIRQRANHENKIEQLESGVFALNMPAKEFYANQAYMSICALAWNMKSWLGLLCPDKELGEQLIRMEFKKFKQYFINIPTQIISQGKYIVFRLLGFNKYVENLILVFNKICKLEFG